MKFNTLGILAFVLLMVGASCSSTETLSPQTAVTSTSVYPSWYHLSGFLADSTTFTGFGTAISSDSAIALQKAEQQARILLEGEVAELTEKVRQALIEGGSSSAANTDFIIILRTAHAQVHTQANSSQHIAKQEDGRYRGFSAVQITKPELVLILEKGFTGHPRYWGEFSGSNLFASLF